MTCISSFSLVQRIYLKCHDFLMHSMVNNWIISSLGLNARNVFVHVLCMLGLYQE